MYVRGRMRPTLAGAVFIVILLLRLRWEGFWFGPVLFLFRHCVCGILYQVSPLGGWTEESLNLGKITLHKFRGAFKSTHCLDDVCMPGNAPPLPRLLSEGERDQWSHV